MYGQKLSAVEIEENWLQGAQACFAHVKRQHCRAGFYSKLRRSEQPWNFEVAAKPFMMCAALRQRLWKPNTLIQLGVTPLSLKAAPWAVEAIQVENDGSLQATIIPADKTRRAEMERTIDSWFRVPQSEQPETTEEAMEVDNAESSELFMQPAISNTGFDQRLSTFKSQAMSRRAEQDNLQGLITRQLLGLEEPRKIPKSQHPIVLIPGRPLSTDQYRIISAFLSETIPVVYADSPAGSGKTFLGAVAVNERLRRNPAEMIIATGPTNCSVINLANAIKEVVPDTRLSLMVISSVASEAKFMEDQSEASRWQMRKLLEQNAQLFTLEDRKFVECYLEARKTNNLTGFQERRAISLAIDALQINVVCCTTAVAEMYLDSRLAGAKTLIADEVGQIPMAQLLSIVVRLPRLQKVLMAGDVHQLPVNLRDLPAAAKRRGMASVAEVVNWQRMVPSLSLRKSYRAHPTLVYCAAAIYDGQFMPFQRAEDLSLLTQSEFPLLHKKYPVMVFHSEANDERLPSKSRHNPVQRSAIAAIVEELNKCPPSESSVVVLTYYVAEAVLLRRCLPSTVTAATIDAYQGKEADLVIVVTTRSMPEIPENLSGNSRNGEFILSEERAAVAITRARHGLFVIGNTRLLSRATTWSAFLQRVAFRVPILDTDAAHLLADVRDPLKRRALISTLPLNKTWLEK
ncbi:hypothetical protein QR680_011894 [Steinernema hermaphroditum]|uniref:DNA2/NAM7 helicase-like C-terminal domain-containing protein n=1 Tax=Steinernema hermaphroditum TaxID=289476 RepID=A0AA39I1Y0_9BILA|nr:hypothetical protein QR680_011894 [Steinernema hermaphroditum]